MGLIYKRLPLQGDFGLLEATALFDTGASRCFVNKDVARHVATFGRAPYALRFEMAMGAFETDEVIPASVTIHGHPLFWTFIVVPDLSEEVILGADFFQSWKIRLDPESEDVTIDPSALRLKLV